VTTAPPPAPEDRPFHITVLGRTLEHLGTQMYKRRDVALAELVANCWDAGATEVHITAPAPGDYDPATSVITLTDDGRGMTATEVDDDYLVIGRNRRAEGQPDPEGRKVMGRKGVGKLAGFGLARRMRVETWRDGVRSTLTLDSAALRTGVNDSKTLEIPGSVSPVPAGRPPTGTAITMSQLKHASPPDVEGLRNALARRFSRTVRGQMTITVNGEKVEEPALTLHLREPDSGTAQHDLGGGRTVTWWAGFSTKVLPKELQGFTVLAHGKTAQAPPYFFDVEATASGQHGTKYLTGVIEADFLDDGTDDDSDRVSTDRQEIDWDDELTAPLKEWGAEQTRRLLRARTKQREKETEKQVDDDPDLKARIDRLDKPTATQVRKFIRALGAAETERDRVIPLADTLLRAYEYRQFHDFITELDDVAAEPERLQQALEHLRTWKVLESRAILEVIKGRLDIVDKFHDMIVGDSPETAPAVGRENMHDLIAEYPWLINPEWQVFAEEKRLTRQLREWGDNDIANPDDRRRYDFLALEGDGGIVVIEIKRSGHPVGLGDLHQLEGYAESLGQSQQINYMLFVSGDRYAIRANIKENWRNRPDADLTTWREIHERTRLYYEHYRDVLMGDVGGTHFGRKQREVARTRDVLQAGAYRGPERRRAGLGPQDVDHAEGPE
jgi:hypothetical protein